MTNGYFFASWALLSTLLLAPKQDALGQVPVITSVVPTANARTAARTSAVTVRFSQPLTGTSAGALKLFSSQRGGLRTRGATPAVVSGNTLSFEPAAYQFLPGETILYTVTTAAKASGGTLKQARTGQFTAAVSTSGDGYFQPGSDPAVGSHPISVVLGDVDGDGDLDVLAANAGSNTVSVRTNNNSGVFSGSQEVPVGNRPQAVGMGDVDGDGDLDLVTASYGSNSVSVRLNNGSGTFAGMQEVAVGIGPISVVLGDVDGDGDLDLLTANYGTSQANGTTVSVRLNDGTGLFEGGQTVELGNTFYNQVKSLALGDVDGDGDFDLLVVMGYIDGVVSVRLNDGAGTFSGSQEVNVGRGACALALGDVDGDNDLDLLTANLAGNSVSVRLNNGTGAFEGSQEVSAVTYAESVALGDIDGDGDLDLLASSGDNGPSTVSVRYNDGSGTFTGTDNVPVENTPSSLTLGDVDGDGDLDMLTANGYSNTVSIRLNRPVVPTIIGFSPASGVAGTRITLTGTNLTRTAAVTVNGKAATFSVASSTALTFVVPAGAGAVQEVVVTATPGGTASSSSFKALLRVASTSPIANALNALRTGSALELTFTEPVTTGTPTTPTAGLAVYSSQVGGRKAGSVQVNGNTLSYTSSLAGARAAFMPGELVSVSVPATVQSVGGLAAEKHVYQFITAVSGPGRGNFQLGSDPVIADYPTSLAVGDVDGDSDLDIVTTAGDAREAGAAVNVLLNSGSGAYHISQTLPQSSPPVSVILGDMDGDGDLDMLTATSASARIALRLNDGHGAFAPPLTCLREPWPPLFPSWWPVIWMAMVIWTWWPCVPGGMAPCPSMSFQMMAAVPSPPSRAWTSIPTS